MWKIFLFLFWFHQMESIDWRSYLPLNLLISQSMVIHSQGEAWLAPLDFTQTCVYMWRRQFLFDSWFPHVSCFPSVELIEYIHCTGFIETNSIFSVCFSFNLFAITYFIPSNLLLCVLSNIFIFRQKQFPKCIKIIICSSIQ